MLRWPRITLWEWQLDKRKKKWSARERYLFCAPEQSLPNTKHSTCTDRPTNRVESDEKELSFITRMKQLKRYRHIVFATIRISDFTLIWILVIWIQADRAIAIRREQITNRNFYECRSIEIYFSHDHAWKPHRRTWPIQVSRQMHRNDMRFQLNGSKSHLLNFTLSTDYLSRELIIHGGVIIPSVSRIFDILNNMNKYCL